MIHTIDARSTWYEAQSTRSESQVKLSESLDVEFCIVGAGLAGLYLASEFAQKDRQVVLLEARQIGFGASGRHGGFCGTGWAAGLDLLEKKIGLTRTKCLFELSLEGFKMVQDTLDTYKVGMTLGWIHPSTYSNADGLRRKRDRMAKHYGYELEYLNTDSLRRCLVTQRYYQALHDQKAFHFNALQLCLILAKALKEAGIPLYENSAMTSFTKTRNGWLVQLEQGTVRTRNLIFCCGGYGGPEFGKLQRAFLPITTYVVVTPPLGKKLGKYVRVSDAVSDERRAGNYYRVVDGDRLFWGGDITAFGETDPNQIALKMGLGIASFFPALADESGKVPVEFAWPGLMGYSRHMMPLVGPIDKGLWACTSFGGHGVNTAPIAARLVREALTGESERWRMFDPFGFHWNGGPFGPLAVETIYFKMQLADLWRAFRSRW